MYRKTIIIIALSFCFLNMQCDEDDVVVDNPCGETVIVNQNLYASAVSDVFEFIDVEIEGDCMLITIGASGCDGETWGFNLFDSGAVAESLPEQRSLKFELVNNEECDAYFERTVSFYLKPLQIDNGVNKVILHLQGWEPSLTYSY